VDISKVSQVWWCISIIPAFRKAEAGESWVWGQSGLHSEILPQRKNMSKLTYFNGGKSGRCLQHINDILKMQIQSGTRESMEHEWSLIQTCQLN
jgi:hypothetical protein